MHFYEEWALRIVGGQLTDHQAFYGLPLYPYLLAVFYKLFGYSAFVPALVQSCADGVTAVLIFKSALLVFDRPRPAQETGAAREQRRLRTSPALVVALCAAGGWALFVAAQAYAVILMPIALGTCAFWLLVFQLLKRDEAPGRLACFGMGWAIGLAAVAVATVSALIPLVLAAIVAKPQAQTVENPRRSRSIGVILLLAGLVVGSAPCWVHNFWIARDPVVLSAHAGVNFWIGNNPTATGYPHFPGLRAGQAEMLEDSIVVAERAAGRRLMRSEVSAYWSNQARDYILSQPMAWIGLLGKKIVNFWNAFEYDDLSIIRRLQTERVLLPGLRFGLIAALAIPGAFFAMRGFPRGRWVAAAILLQMLAVLPVFVTERYRIAVVPGLLIFAAFGLVWLWQQLARLELRSAALYMVMLAGTTAFVSLPPNDLSVWALGAYNSGRQALEQGDLARAEAELQRAKAYAPGNPEAAFALGNVRLAQGDRAGAKAFYTQTLAREGTHKRALNNLGVMALGDGRADIAEVYFTRALDQEPGNANTQYLLARALLAQYRPDAAKSHIEQALSSKPNQPEFLALRDQIDSALAAASKP